MVKYGRAGQATDNSRTQHTRFTCWVSKATETLRICNIIAFHGNTGYANASLFYVIRTLPALFGLAIVFVRTLFNLLLRICTVLYLICHFLCLTRLTVPSWTFVFLLFSIVISRISGICYTPDFNVLQAIPVYAWTGPEGSRRLWLPEFLGSRHIKVARLKPYSPAAFPHRRYPRYSFLLEAELTPRT